VKVAAAPRTIVIAANSCWNILNFRGSLIRGLKNAGYAPVVVAPEDLEAEARMAELDTEWIRLRLDRSGLNPVSDLLVWIGYRKLLKRVRPSAFLSFTVKPNIYGCLAAASLGIPAMPNVSGLGTAFIRGGALQGLVSGLYRLAFRKAEVVFFQNPDDRGLFVERGLVREEQTRLLPGSGIDLDRFQPKAPFEGPAIFLLIGRLLGDKGVREYVEAARLVHRKLPDVRLQLLGPIDDGNRTGIRRDELDRWVAEGAVEYIEASEDVRPFIAAATAIVLPSYREGLPRTLLEGAAMGRPLIASDVPGCRELVDDGLNGYLCKVRDARSLAEAMLKLASLGDSERAAMGAASRRKVEERFGEDLVISAYLEELARLEATSN
jgi:glycosyltransferase involved in cell wall biosynthesis